MLDKRYQGKHIRESALKRKTKKRRIWWPEKMGDSVVYMHRNRRSGKIYIGYTTRACYERWTYAEYKKTKKRDGNCTTFYNALMKEKRLYDEAGVQSSDRFVGFESRILVDGLSAELAPKVEEATIAFFRGKGCELYNLTDGGDGAASGDMNPMKRPEVREAKSEAMKEYYENHPEAREAKSEAMKGEDNPMKRPEVREAKSEAMKEYYENHPEAREAKSEAMKGEDNPMKRPEVREAQSERMKGENNPMKRPEVREAKSEAMKGENNPMFGKQLSEETRKKMSDAQPKKAVIAIDPKTGECRYYFKSTMDAERAGFNKGHVSSCCNNKLKTHKGWEWYHLKDWLTLRS